MLDFAKIKFVTSGIVFQFLFITLFSAHPVQNIYASSDLPIIVTNNQSTNELNFVGITVNPNNFLDLKFHINTADSLKPNKKELHKLINLFIASLSFDAEDLWVNLSPYEKDRIISDKLARTEFGEILLTQDAKLKQVSASLTHPDTDLGKQYWQEMEGKDSIHDFINKIWIIPEKSEVLVKENSAYITASSMTLDNANDMNVARLNNKTKGNKKFADNLMAELYRQVNNSAEFTELRQLYNAVILGRWFRKKYINSSFEKLYGSKSIDGIDNVSANLKRRIYNDYVRSFKKGIYKIQRKVIDQLSGKKVKKSYFSGGIIPVVEPISSAVGVVPDYYATMQVTLEFTKANKQPLEIDIDNSQVPLYVDEYFSEATVYQPQLVAASAIASDNKRFVQIHGHFYQPPREDPWTGKIPYQPSAFKRDGSDNWNEVITRECYKPNAQKTPIEENGNIVREISNYSYMSFNIGPTLISWMRDNDKETYDSIVQANREAYERTGHPSALAQVYNHMIMPLANHEDKVTQVKWALADYKYTYGMDAEGIWLGETAIDIPTMEVLANEGVKFTILSPSQASKIKHFHNNDWHDVSGMRIDPKKPYLVKLPSGKEFTVFFYDGPVSAKIGFQGLLKDGYNFADQLMNAFVHDRDDKQFVNVATDGESYGHHSQFGNLALSYAIHKILNTDGIDLALYGEVYEHMKPDHEVELYKESAWSCAHGVGRWKEDCGCEHGDYNQQWRKPLRDSFDYLRDSIHERYVNEMTNFTNDPWNVRNEYINIINNPSKENYEKFFKDNFKKELKEEEKLKVLRMLEMQRNALLMYTSCAWFFEEVSRLEPVQNMRYAARLIQLAKQTFGIELESDYLDILRQAESNEPELGNGADIYLLSVKADVDNTSQYELNLFKNAFDDFDKLMINDLVYKKASSEDADASIRGIFNDIYKIYKHWLYSQDKAAFNERLYEYIKFINTDDLYGAKKANLWQRFSNFMSELIDIFNKGDYSQDRYKNMYQNPESREVKGPVAKEDVLAALSLLQFSSFNRLKKASEIVSNKLLGENLSDDKSVSSSIQNLQRDGGINLFSLDSKSAQICAIKNKEELEGLEIKARIEEIVINE